MSSFVIRNTHFLQDQFNPGSELSYINFIQENYDKQPKRNQLKVHSNIKGTTKSRDKNPIKKSKCQNPISRSVSRKKSKTCQRSISKTKKTMKKATQKVHVNSKKGYKTTNIKPQERKLKPRKSQKTNPSSKKLGLESVFQKTDTMTKKKIKDEIHMKAQKKCKTQQPKEMRQTRLNKSKSQSALDTIPLSQIIKGPKFGTKQSKVIHEYFGIEDKLSSIVEEKFKDKFKKQKLRTDKSKTRSSASSLSSKKGSKFILKSGKIVK